MGAAEKNDAYGRLLIRPAVEDDLPHIARIYNQAILETTATFDTEPKSTEDWRSILLEHNEVFPLVVAELDETVVAWGALRPFIKRPAARHTVENAVYVDSAHHGRGIGSDILAHLLDCARRAGHHAVIALVVAGNAASERLHLKMGFRQVGVLREVGFKFDRWLDLVIFEKLV
ncbi:MAG: GNAT family N-acetyltransferase [Armatimonadota bacterium]